jgi:hypothetical protein
MADSIEILFRFVGQGASELDRAAEGAKKVEDSAKKAGGEVDKLGGALGKTAEGAKKVEDSAKKAGGEVDKLGKSLAAAGGAWRSLDGVGDKVRSGLTDPLGAAGDSAESFVARFGRAKAAILSAAAAVGLVGKQVFDLVAAQGAAAQATLNLADRLGVSAGQMERLQAQARIANVNVGSLEGAARTLGLALEDSAGGGARAAAGLRGLGVATREMNGELRGSGAVLLDTLGKLSKIDSDSERVFRALQVLPKGAALELLPLIKNFEDLQRTVESVGVGVEDGLTKRLAAADSAIGRMEIAWDRLKRALSGGIAADVVIAVSSFVTDSVAGQRGALKIDPRNPNSLRDQVTNYRNGVPSGDPMADLRSRADARSRDRAAELFRAAEAQTVDGRRARIADLDRKIANLVGALSEGIDLAKRPEKVAELARARAEKTSLEASLRPAKSESGVLRIGDLFSRSARELRPARPSLVRPLDALGVFRAEGFQSGEDVGAAGLIPDAFNVGGRSGRRVDLESVKAFADGLLESEKVRRDLAERRTRLELDAAIRLLELGDNEFENARRVRDLKLATAGDVIEARQAELEYSVRIAEVEKRRLDRARDTAGRVFDSINSREGGFGLADFVRGQRDVLMRQVFVNGTAGLFKELGGVGGSVGRALGPFGKLFEGTFLDPAGGSETDKNTTAVDKNTTAVERLTSAVSKGGGMSGLLDSVFVSDGKGITGAGGIGGLLSKVPGLNRTSGVTNFFDSLFGTKGGKGLASAAGLGFGGLQLAQGVRGGGAGSIISGALGVASAIPGPQQGAMQLAALLAPMFTGLFGSSRQKFDREQSELLNSRRFIDPVSGSRASELFGGGEVATDFDFRGRTRIVIQRTVNVKIDALDARSIDERGYDLSQAVAKAVDAGMPIAESINRAVFGAGVA